VFAAGDAVKKLDDSLGLKTTGRVWEPFRRLEDLVDPPVLLERDPVEEALRGRGDDDGPAASSTYSPCVPSLLLLFRNPCWARSGQVEQYRTPRLNLRDFTGAKHIG
jgi:hypothetical protein